MAEATKTRRDPVMVHQYIEKVKMEIGFNSDDPTDYPIIVWGSGNGVGNHCKGYMYKDASGMFVKYVNKNGIERVIREDDNGMYISAKQGNLTLEADTINLRGKVVYNQTISNDTVPPKNLTSMSATADVGRVLVAWELDPTDTDIESVTIVRTTGGYAVSADMSDSTNLSRGARIIYCGSDNMVIDDGLNEGTYYYRAFIRDMSGNINSSDTNETSAVVSGSSNKSTTLTLFTANTSTNLLVLTWQLPTYKEVSKVVIVMKSSGYPTSEDDGNIVFNKLGTKAWVGNLLNNVQYYFRAFVYFADGTQTADDNPANKCVGTPKTDNIPPYDLTSFTATAGSGCVNLAWNFDPRDYDLKQIIIVRTTTDYAVSTDLTDTVNISRQAVILKTVANVHTFTDNAVIVGTKYYYRAFVYDLSGNVNQNGMVFATPK